MLGYRNQSQKDILYFHSIVICGYQGQAWAGLLFKERRVSMWDEERLLEVDSGDGNIAWYDYVFSHN